MQSYNDNMKFDLKMENQKDLSRFFTNFDIPQIVCLYFGDAKFLVNSVILSMHSARFEALIKKGCQQISITKRNLTEPVVRDCLSFLHGRSITITSDNVYEFYEFASIYDIECLKIGCRNCADTLVKSFDIKQKIAMFVQYSNFLLSRKYLEIESDNVAMEILEKHTEYSDLWTSENADFFRRLAERCSSKIGGSLLLRLYRDCKFDNKIFLTFPSNLLELPEHKGRVDLQDYQRFVSEFKKFSDSHPSNRSPGESELEEIERDFSGLTVEVPRDHKIFERNVEDTHSDCHIPETSENIIFGFRLDMILCILGVALPVVIKNCLRRRFS